MVAADPTAVYRKNQVTTASPERIVLLLYDGALRSLRRGGGAMRRGDIQETGNNLCHAQEIIAALLGALDREAGGSLAENMAALYNYILRLVARANVEKDPSPLEEAIVLLGEIREGWQGALLPGHATPSTAG
ncbi:MAG: flagellar export chaperone FliS [Peptococcaceae bacterium]|jgi:flagellar protein FliS|nr:flagellar export chaperone FliS [Peptococcaceae bacterium]